MLQKQNSSLPFQIFYSLGWKRHTFKTIRHLSSLWMDMMLMVRVYNLTLMIMSALMSYRSSCPIYHYQVNSSVHLEFQVCLGKRETCIKGIAFFLKSVPKSQGNACKCSWISHVCKQMQMCTCDIVSCDLSDNPSFFKGHLCHSSEENIFQIVSIILLWDFCTYVVVIRINKNITV